jgi:octaprenyl-diphosphate synthase
VNITQFSAPVKSELDKLEQLFEQTLHADVPLVEQVMQYVATLHGKRLRPLLVFLTAKMIGEVTEQSLKAGLVVELLHTATLIHDDVVDHSTLRRGVPTVNSIWTNKISVLIGDYLFSRTLSAMVDIGDLRSLNILSQTAKRITQGELLQIERGGDFKMDESVYFRLVSDKTGSLFSASCQLGALSANANDSAVQLMSQFGENLGIAFQIKDDLLDYTGSTQKLGKPTGKDIRENNITLPLIHALRKANNNISSSIIKTLEAGVDENGVEEIISFVRDYGGLEYSHQVASDYATKAAEFLNGYQPSQAKQSLEALVDFAVVREN